MQNKTRKKSKVRSPIKHLEADKTLQELTLADHLPDIVIILQLPFALMLKKHGIINMNVHILRGPPLLHRI